MALGRRWVAGLSGGLIAVACLAGCSGGNTGHLSTGAGGSSSSATEAPTSAPSSTTGSSGSSSPSGSSGQLSASGAWNGKTFDGPVQINSNNCVQATSGGSPVMSATLSGLVGGLQIGLVLNGAAGSYSATNHGNATVDLQVNGDYGHQPALTGGTFSIASSLKSATFDAQFGSPPNQLTLRGTFDCS